MGIASGRGFFWRLRGVITTSALVGVWARVLGLSLMGIRRASAPACPLNASIWEEHHVGGKEGLTGELRVIGLYRQGC